MIDLLYSYIGYDEIFINSLFLKYLDNFFNSISRANVIDEIDITINIKNYFFHLIFSILTIFSKELLNSDMFSLLDNVITENIIITTPRTGNNVITDIFPITKNK